MKALQDRINEGFFDNMGMSADPKILKIWDRIINAKNPGQKIYKTSLGGTVIVWRDALYNKTDLETAFNKWSKFIVKIADKKEDWYSGDNPEIIFGRGMLFYLNEDGASLNNGLNKILINRICECPANTGNRYTQKTLPEFIEQLIEGFKK